MAGVECLVVGCAWWVVGDCSVRPRALELRSLDTRKQSFGCIGYPFRWPKLPQEPKLLGVQLRQIVGPLKTLFRAARVLKEPTPSR